MRAHSRRSFPGAALALLPAASAALLLALLGALAAERSAGRQGAAPVYTVAALRAHLTQDQRRWVGRTLLVRGEVVPCLAMPSVGDGPCAALAPSGWQPSQGAAADPLPVVHGGLDPVLAPLRCVPHLGTLLPAPQVLQWGAEAAYRVRLRASAHSICGPGVCYEAVLLDAAPDALDGG